MKRGRGISKAAHTDSPDKTASGSTMTAQKHRLLPIALLVCAVIALLIGSVYLAKIVRQNQPDGIVAEALQKSFFSLADGQALSVSGDAYVESSSSGTSYGVTFSGQIASDGFFAITADTNYLVAGSRTMFVRFQRSDPPLLKVIGIGDITNMYLVGGAAFDTKLYMLLRDHKDAVDNTWYQLTAEDGYERVLSMNGLTFLPLFMRLGGSANDVQAAYVQHPFLQAQKVYSGEILQQTPTSYYTLTINSTDAAAFIGALQKTWQLSSDDMTVLVDFAKNIKNLGIWVNRDSKLVEQIRLVYVTGDKTYTLRMQFSPAMPRSAVDEPQDIHPGQELIDILRVGN